MLTLTSFFAICGSVYRVNVLELPETGNAAWLSVLLGAFLACPALFAGYALVCRSGACVCTGIRAAVGNGLYRALCALLAAAFVLEAASSFSVLTGSAAYATLYAVPGWALLAFTFASVTLIAYRGGNAAGGVAAVWGWAAPALYALTVIPQIQSLNPHWLFPILGPGWKTLLRCAIPTALLFSMIPFIMILDDDDSPKANRPRGMLWLFALCAVTSACLCAVHATVYPSLSGLSGGRSMRLDLLLSGGKTNRAVQLPMLLIWYGTLMTGAAFFVYAAGRFLCAALNRQHSLYALAAGALALLLAASGFPRQGISFRVCLPAACAEALVWGLIWTAKGIRRRAVK